MREGLLLPATRGTHAMTRATGPRRRRLRSWAGRAAMTVLTAGVALVAAPTPAVAATANDVNPVLDCVAQNPDGTWTAVLGYDNTSILTVTVSVTSLNKIEPGRFKSLLPTIFEPGRHQGVFSVTLRKGESATWYLGNDTLSITADGAPACPPSTQMPAEGNGVGPVVGLAAAGVLGAVVIRRMRRRAEAATASPAGPEGVGPDA